MTQMKEKFFYTEVTTKEREILLHGSHYKRKRNSFTLKSLQKKEKFFYTEVTTTEREILLH